MADQRVRIIIEGNDTSASAALDNVEKKAKSLQSSLQGIGQGMTSFGTKMSLGVTAPILGFAGAAIKAAADQEQLQVAFTTMLGSAEAAKTMMAELSQFAATTPFESPEIQNASKMLLAYGVSAKDIIPTMTNLGDIAAGLNIPLGDMAMLFGTTRASGRLMTADLNQFTTRGIPMIAALAKTMGIAESEVKAMVEAGKVGFPEVQAALASMTAEGGQFAGLMEAQSQTLSGLFSTFSDTIGLTLAEVGRVIIDTFDLKTKLAGALEWLGQAKEALLGFAKTNPELFKLGIIIAGVAAAIGPLLIGLGMIVGWVSAALPVLGAIAGAFGLLFTPIGLVVAGIAALIALDVFGLRTAIVDFGETAFAWFQTVQEAAGKLFAAFQRGELFTVFEDGSSAIGNFAESLGVSEELVTKVGLAVYDLREALKFDDIWTTWEDGSSVIGGFLEDLGASEEAVMKVGMAVYTLKDAWANFSGGPDFTAFSTEAMTIFDQVKDAFSGLFSGDMGLGEFTTKIGEALSGIPGMLGDLFGGSDFAALRGQIVAALGLDKIDFSQVLASFESFGQQLADQVAGFDFSRAFAGLQNVKADLEVGAASLRDGAIEAVAGAINSIDWSAASLNVAGIIDWISTKINSIDWSTISIADIGAAIAGVVAPALTNGIRAIAWVLSSDAWGGFVDAVKNAFANIQWGELGESLAGLGTAVIGAITEIDWSPVTIGLDSLKTTVATAVAGIDWTAVADSITTGLETLKTGANTLRDDVLANLSSSFEQMDLTGAFTGFVGNVTTSITNVDWTTVGAAVGAALSFALDPNTLTAALATAVTAVAPAVVAAIAGITWIVSSENFAGLIGSIGTAITNIDWSAVTASFEGFKAAVSKAMGDFVAGFTGGKGFQAPEWLTTLNETVTALMGTPGWAISLASSVGALFADPSWVGTVRSSVTDWFKTPGWVSTVASAVSDWFKTPGWLSNLTSAVSNWFKTPGWISSLQSAITSFFSAPGWLTSFTDAISALLRWNPLSLLTGNEPGQATGTNFFRGGMTWVGERGPELVNVPRGAQVMNHERSAQFAMAGGGEMHNTFNFYVYNELDAEEIAQRVLDVVRRHR